MSNKKRNTLIVLLLIVTNLITFSVSNVLALKNNSKVLISAKEYDELLTSYNEQGKANMLKDYIKENYLGDIDDASLDEGQLAGIFQALGDPYSGYLTKEEFKSLEEQTSGSYGGIGVVVSPGEDGLITVVSAIANTPGEKAGLRTGDKIVKVDGVEYGAEDMDKAVKNMKGKANTKVKLTILRRSKGKADEFIDLDIKRENIKIETIETDIVDDIGYIKISSFDEETHKDLKKGLEELEAKDVKGLVLDLRNNPGGLLDVCVDIADEFLDEGTVVYTQTRSGDKEYEKSKDGKTDLPMAVLVNEGSASASEILAGALQDRKRATIIGENTFGKGVVQRIKKLKDGTGFKLTESEYFTPNGNTVHDKGIKPDIELKLGEDVREIGISNLKNDSQLLKAIEILKK